MIGFAGRRGRYRVERSQNKRPRLLVVFLRTGRLLKCWAERGEICYSERICGGRRAFISPAGMAETAFSRVSPRLSDCNLIGLAGIFGNIEQRKLSDGGTPGYVGNQSPAFQRRVRRT